ncbi:hypothetical protein LZ30DRAFT_312861 [Colletotrichum cereale]|nr:hypothetical protein LZ30DRAFT_312861 [Colletotrichum cereale]
MVKAYSNLPQTTPTGVTMTRQRNNFPMLSSRAWQKLGPAVQEWIRGPENDQNTGPVPCGVTWLVGIMIDLGRWTKSVAIVFVRSDVRVTRRLRYSTPQKNNYRREVESLRASHMETAAGLLFSTCPGLNRRALSRQSGTTWIESQSPRQTSHSRVR